MLYFEEIETKLLFGVEKLDQSFPVATSEQSPHLTLGTLGPIKKKFQGSGNGLSLSLNEAEQVY